MSEAGHPVPFQQHVAPPCQRHHHYSLGRRAALLAEPPFPALQIATLAAHHSSVSHPQSQTRHPQQPVSSLLPFICLPCAAHPAFMQLCLEAQPVAKQAHKVPHPASFPPCNLPDAAMRTVSYIQRSVCVWLRRGFTTDDLMLELAMHSQSHCVSSLRFYM